ncbi:hypothetical protein ACTGWV_10025, partial [Streptococcus suis]
AWALSVRRRAVTVTVSSWPLALSPLPAGAGVSAAWAGDQLVLPATNIARGKDLNRLIRGSRTLEYSSPYIPKGYLFMFLRTFTA